MDYIKELLEKVFINNHEVLEGKNPDSIYLVSFSKAQIDDYERRTTSALKKLDRKFISINAEGKTFLDIVEEITGNKPNTKIDGWELIQDIQYKNDIAIIFKNFSKSNISPKKASFFRQFIKNLDDAHYKNIHPKSDLIFIDYASYLEKNWKTFGTYLVYNIWPNSLTEAEHFTNMFYLQNKRNN